MIGILKMLIKIIVLEKLKMLMQQLVILLKLFEKDQNKLDVLLLLDLGQAIKIVILLDVIIYLLVTISDKKLKIFLILLLKQYFIFKQNIIKKLIMSELQFLKNNIILVIFFNIFFYLFYICYANFSILSVNRYLQLKII